MQQVARHAHKYAHRNDELPFNLSRFNKDMRNALYNTQRNTKKRAAVNTPKSGDVETASVAPNMGEGTSKVTKQKPRPSGRAIIISEDESSASDNAPISREKEKKKSSPDPVGDDAKVDLDIDPDADTEVDTNSPQDLPKASSSRSRKRSGTSAVNAPAPKRTKAMRPKVFDHVMTLSDANANVDDVIATLRTYAKQHGHRKGMVTAARHVLQLAKELEDNDGQEDWVTCAARYKAALMKLPATSM